MKLRKLAVHAVRNVQKEYVGKKAKNVRMEETLCGRHYPAGSGRTARKPTCRTCLRALKACR